MADEKLSQLPPPAGGPAAGDLLYLVDVDDPTDGPAGSSRQTTAADLLALVPSGSVLTGLTVWVDSVNGDDGTGTRGNQRLPFLTPEAAAAAAQSGDLVHVRPGDYTVTASLAKDLVHWRFEAGATVTRTDGSGGIFDDGGAAMTFTVDGRGVFSRAIANAEVGSVVTVSHVDSRVSIKARTLTAYGQSVALGAIALRHDDGVLSVEVDSIEVAGDPFVSVSAVWWTNGSLSLRADRLVNTGSGQSWTVYCACNSSPTGECNITADEIVGPFPFSLQGTNAEQAVWVTAKTIRGTSNATAGISLSGNGRYYLECEKLFGRVTASNVEGGASRTFIRAQRWSAIGDGGATAGAVFQFNSGTHNAILDVQEIDPAGFGSGMMTVAAGTVELRGTRYTGTASSFGVLVSGGTLTLRSCVLDTTANDATNPVTVAGGSLVLDNCTLIAEGTRNAIEASGAATVTVRGTLTVNRPLHANVTVAGGPVVRSDSGDLTTAGKAVVRGAVGVPATVAQITSNQAAFNPGSALFQRWSSDASRFLQGMVAGVDGEVRVVRNVGSNAIIVLHEDGAASAANRFNLNTVTSRCLIAPNDLVLFVYDGTTQRWACGKVVPDGLAASTSFAISADTSALINIGSVLRIALSDKGVNLPGTLAGEGEVAWTDASSPTGGSRDTSVRRRAAGVVGLSKGATTAGATLASLPLTPATITADQNNYNPGVARFYRLSTDGLHTLTGLSIGQVDGQECEIWNVGSVGFNLANESASSTAANRFTTTTGADVALAPNEMAFLRWFSADQSNTGRWRLVKGS